jgi:hypothetical protein
MRCGKAALIQAQREFVAGGCSQICQTVMQFKDECSRHQSAERNGRVAALKPPERIAADKKTRRHVARGDAALAPRERKVAAQFAKRMGGGQRDGATFQHGFSVPYW